MEPKNTGLDPKAWALLLPAGVPSLPDFPCRRVWKNPLKKFKIPVFSFSYSRYLRPVPVVFPGRSRPLLRISTISPCLCRNLTANFQIFISGGRNFPASPKVGTGSRQTTAANSTGFPVKVCVSCFPQQKAPISCAGVLHRLSISCVLSTVSTGLSTGCYRGLPPKIPLRSGKIPDPALPVSGFPPGFLPKSPWHRISTAAQPPRIFLQIKKDMAGISRHVLWFLLLYWGFSGSSGCSGSSTTLGMKLLASLPLPRFFT